MFEFIVLITFASLATSTWFSAERTDVFLRSFNTTFTYMKLFVFMYSFFNGPTILESFVLLDLLQCYTNLEKEIKEDNPTLLELLKWCGVNIIKIISLNHPVISPFAGYIVRMLYVVKWTNTQEFQSFIVLGFLGWILRHFNSSDLYTLHKLALVIGIYAYMYATSGMDKIIKERYIYNNESLPIEVFKSFLQEEQILSNKPLFEILTKAKEFYAFLCEGNQQEKDNVIIVPVVPDIMTSINSLRISIQTHKKDNEDVVLWINTTKQLLVFYVQDLLKEEKDDKQRTLLESYLSQNDPFRKRSNAVHVVAEFEEEELKIDDNDPNIEGMMEDKKEPELDESFSSEEESSGDSDDLSGIAEATSDSQQIL